MADDPAEKMEANSSDDYHSWNYVRLVEVIAKPEHWDFDPKSSNPYGFSSLAYGFGEIKKALDNFNSNMNPWVKRVLGASGTWQGEAADEFKGIIKEFQDKVSNLLNPLNGPPGYMNTLYDAATALTNLENAYASAMGIVAKGVWWEYAWYLGWRIQYYKASMRPIPVGYSYVMVGTWPPEIKKPTKDNTDNGPWDLDADEHYAPYKEIFKTAMVGALDTYKKTLDNYTLDMPAPKGSSAGGSGSGSGSSYKDQKKKLDDQQKQNEKDIKAQQDEFKKEQKEAQAEAKKEQKEAQAEAKKEQKEAQAEAKKEQKEAQAEAKKQTKEQQDELKKQQKEQQDELKQQQKEAKDQAKQQQKQAEDQVKQQQDQVQKQQQQAQDQAGQQQQQAEDQVKQQQDQLQKQQQQAQDQAGQQQQQAQGQAKQQEDQLQQQQQEQQKQLADQQSQAQQQAQQAAQDAQQKAQDQVGQLNQQQQDAQDQLKNALGMSPGGFGAPGAGSMPDYLNPNKSTFLSPYTQGALKVGPNGEIVGPDGKQFSAPDGTKLHVGSNGQVVDENGKSYLGPDGKPMHVNNDGTVVDSKGVPYSGNGKDPYSLPDYINAFTPVPPPAPPIPENWKPGDPVPAELAPDIKIPDYKPLSTGGGAGADPALEPSIGLPGGKGSISPTTRGLNSLYGDEPAVGSQAGRLPGTGSAAEEPGNPYAARTAATAEEQAMQQQSSRPYGGMPMSPMAGGHGAGQQGQHDEQSTWLQEDNLEVWGADPDVAPAFLDGTIC